MAEANGMGARQLVRRLLLVGAMVWLLGLASLAVALNRASPGPAGQDVQGVGIGRYDEPGGIAYISGRQLACAPITRAPFTSRCTVEIAGQTLELFAGRNPPGHPNQLGGACEAHYAGRMWPCRIGGRHVHVQWFAYLEEPLGLTAGQLGAVRRMHPLPNLPERPFLVGILVVPALTAVAAASGAAIWLVAGGHHRVTVVVAGALAGPVAFVGTFVLAVRATAGFWD